MKKNNYTIKKLYSLIVGLVIAFGSQAVQLSGSYTINATNAATATNFKDLVSAVNYLTSATTRPDGGPSNVAPFGVSGPVTFNIATGTYSGQTIIPFVTGTSASNTITFRSGAIHTDSVTLNYSSGTNPVVRLDSARYINFRFITITTAAGRAFELTKGASYDTISNCKMTVGSSGIYATNLIGGRNVFMYNSITGGQYSIWLRGTSTSYSDSNLIANNTLLNATTNGCNFYYTVNLLVKNNVIRSAGTVTTLLIGYCNNSFFANNSIVSGGTGIDNTNSFSQRFYHNSISAVNIGISVVYNNATYSNNDWRNNIISSSGTLTTSAAANINLTGSSNNTWNFNTYDAKSANLFATTPSSYNAWLGTGQDGNSVVVVPGFLSTTDLHVNAGCKRGTPLPTVTTDIEGNPRNNPPTMGAYEYVGTNNLTVSGLLQPSTGVITPGLQDLKVIVRNIGTNAVTAFNLSYVLNSGTVVTQPWTGTLAPCDTVSVLFTGANQVDLLSINTLKMYTANPNATVDSAPINDTLVAYLYSPLNGTYTIGATGANFATFTQAINALKIGGITGPVVFNAQNGTYTEQLVIPAISGTSAINTITFKSAINNADSVSIRFNAGANIPIVKIDLANYINFKYISVSSLTPTTGRSFELTGTSSFDSITSCKIGAGNHGIYAAAITGSRNVFSYNTITGSGIGIYLYGISATVQTENNIIAYNTILSTAGFGCDLRFTTNLTVNNNTITGNNAAQIQYSYGVLRIISNVINGTNAGLLNYYAYGNSQDPALIANNRITSSSSGGTALYNYQGANQRYYHNTISSANTGAGFDYAATNNDNNDWRNNIIVSASASAGSSIGGTNLGANNTLNYNLYYTVSGASPFSTFANLAAWQAARGWDLNSIVVNPDFASTTDFHLKSGCKLGAILTAVPTDIEGNPRNTPPTMGAYEYSVINDMAIDKIVQPEVGNTLAGLQDLVVRVKNTGSSAVTSFDISYVLNSGSAVMQSWTGSLAPCDTVSVTFSGTNRINLSNTNTITVYTSNPNMAIDPNRTNDTLTKLLYPSLNGTYTIGHSGAHFASFNAAVTALINGGVMGPVVFQVQTGTYTEQLTIPAIVGASATNTITFKSAVNHADSVIVNYAAATEEHVIKLLSASYINFKYLTVSSLSTFGRLFTFLGTSSYDSITYCNIKTGQMGVFANVNGRKHVFSYNTISALGFGIYLAGTGTAELSDSNIITFNTIQNPNSGLTYGCYLSYTKNIKINNNIITGYSNGIRGYYHRDLMEILANRITALGTSSNGIYISEVFGTPDKYALIANNSIVSDDYGINNINGSYQRYYHNSINAIKSGLSISYDALSIYNEWKNNIVATQVATGGFTVFADGSLITNKFDYNLYYNASLVSPIRFYTSLATWQNGTGNDKHSFVYAPPFTSTTNLYPNVADSGSWAINGRGIHFDSTALPLISTDINGNLRPTSRAAGVPDIGAYEITPTALPPLAIASGYLMLDSTRIFISPISLDTVAKIKLWGSSDIPAKLEIRQYTGIAPPIAKSTDKFMYHYLDIKDSGSGSYFYDITTYYNEIWLGTITAEQDLRLTHKKGSSPWSISNSAIYSSVDTLKNTIIDGQLLQFGLVTGTDLFNVLPVELMLFKANALAKDVLLTWATASELNSNSFFIERSTDNKNWNKIGIVKANGNTNAISNYQLNDANAFVHANTLFYRLRMVDNDGSYAYSTIVCVSNKPKATTNELIVYPNPFTSNVAVLFVADNAETKATITVTNITGQTVHTEMVNTMSGSNNATINLEGLQNGIYLISVELNGSKTHMKLVKN